ncbi:MAG: penicillin-binding protein [Bacillota bacterium]|nr:MAG: penicillin-binding protein [Bacillota bacterium]
MLKTVMIMRFFVVKSLFYLGSIFMLAIVSILFTGLITFSILPPFVQPEASLIYGNDGTIIAKIFAENRESISYNQVAPDLVAAIIATEDARFYSHRGIDFIGLLRAIIENIRTRRFAQGASSITQQLARNLYNLPMEKTIRRKLQEAWLAILLERHFSKEEILERYLNEIYLGHGTYGVEAASQLYFTKPASDLNLAEASMLAGIIRGPEIYSPRVNFERAKTRQSWVLERMVTVGAINREQADQAKDAQLTIAATPTKQTGGGYLRDIVQKTLGERLEDGATMLATAGLKIHTSIDPQAQAAAEAAAARIPVTRTDARGTPQPQIALVAIDPQTGEVRAWVGGRGTATPQFNRVVDAVRSPGSAFKPFLYITALEQGLTAAMQIECEPTTFALSTGTEWTPSDFGTKYHERPLSLREAVVLSCNVVAARLIDQLSPQAVVNTARRLGIQTPLNPVLSLALGTSETTALNMAIAFTPLANGGRTITQNVGNPILRVEDKQGRVLFETKPLLIPGALDPRVAYIMTDILRDVLTPPGTGQRASTIFPRPAAGKTGTSEDYRDAWFVGYSPTLVCAVYVGDDENLPLGGTGGGLATPVWAEFMRDAHAGLPLQNFVRPVGLDDATICQSSLLLARAECPAELRRTEIFMPGTTPTEDCSVHAPIPLFPWPWNWFRNDQETP